MGDLIAFLHLKLYIWTTVSQETGYLLSGLLYYYIAGTSFTTWKLKCAMKIFFYNDAIKNLII